jgi:hypothetical protein
VNGSLEGRPPHGRDLDPLDASDFRDLSSDKRRLPVLPGRDNKRVWTIQKAQLKKELPATSEWQ